MGFKDFMVQKETIDDKKILPLAVDAYKKYIFWKIRPKASVELQKIQKSTMKVKCIDFKDLNRPYNYLGHKSFSNKLSSFIFDLRCRNVKGTVP